MIRTSRLGGVVCAAVSFSLFAACAAARDGYVGVRVAGDEAGCAAVVLKWPLDQPRQDYVPQPLPVREEVPVAAGPCGDPCIEPSAPVAADPCVATEANPCGNEPPDVEPIINEPAAELAETTPVPVISHHPALNAGTLFFPPADGYYRHYLPEEEPSPYTWHGDKGQYEEYRRHTFPYYDPRFTAPGVAEELVDAVK